MNGNVIVRLVSRLMRGYYFFRGYRNNIVIRYKQLIKEYDE